MKSVRLFFISLFIGGWALAGYAQEAAAPTTTVDSSTAAAAAVSSGAIDAKVPQFVEEMVDAILELFDVRTTGNSWQHYAIAAGILIVFFLVRHVVVSWVFGFLKRLASRTRTTFDDKLFPALQTPAATFIALLGVFTALKVLKLTPGTDEMLRVASTVAFSLCFFWALLRVLGAFLDHMQELATAKQSSVAAFMPWIKKSLITLFAIISVLLVAQSMGANVKAFLAGLGIGGLAFALAAQDTIANLFGSVVVAIDQPFKLGDAVKIGANEGTVEDIGLRSTKLRRPDRSIAVLPNKTVAAEAIINNSRINARRLEQVLNLTYDATPEQMEAIVEEIRALILAEPEVDPKSVMVFFRDLSASSLDIWVVYMTKSADFQAFMRLRQRLNLAFMRAVSARGLSFAFPTQTFDLSASAAKMFGAGAGAGQTVSSATQTKQP